MKTLLLVLGAILPISSASAAITITNTGSRNNDFGSGTLATLDFSSLSTTTNTAVFFVYALDGSTASTTATFAGQSMTIVQDGRVAIGYLANPTNKTGNIVLTTGNGAGNELAYWGLAQGINTTNIKTAVGTTIGGTTQTNGLLTSLIAGDVVFSGFAVNNFTNAAYSGGLVRQNGTGSEFDGIVTRHDIISTGNFQATTTVASGVSSVGAGGASIAFTAIPEPGAAVLGGLGMVLLLRRRRVG